MPCVFFCVGCCCCCLLLVGVHHVRSLLVKRERERREKESQRPFDDCACRLFSGLQRELNWCSFFGKPARGQEQEEMSKRHRPGASATSVLRHVEEVVLATSGEDA